MIKDTNINYSIKRHIEEHVKECIKQYQCVVLTGPRQVGKSTLIESILPSIGNYKIVKLDSTELINYAKTDPIAFFNEYQPPVFIDEVQKAPELFNYIKELIDKHKQKSMFILTGSESFELIKGVGDTLSTRAALIDLQSLSISEINGRANFVFEPDYNKFLLRKCKQKTQLEIFKDIINGSMPDVINGSKTNLDTFYKTYIKSTLFKDIREDVLNISNFEDFLNFLSLMASLVGETLNYTSIARKVGVTPLTIKK
jgi:predicted AAA+ superfamily ATPase